MKTAEELAEACEKISDSCCGECYKQGFLTGYRAATPQWISVEDALPVDHHAVIWLLTDNLMAIGSLDREQRGIFIDSCFFKLKEATHWMPLPKAPKEGK